MEQSNLMILQIIHQASFKGITQFFIIVTISNKQSGMKKPTFMKKLISLPECAQSCLLNPESPLIAFRKIQETLVFEGIQPQFKPKEKQELAKEPIAHINRIIFPKSNRLKQQLTHPLSRFLEQEEKKVQSAMQKQQKRRIKTVPYDSHQKYRILDENKEIEMKPVLVITQIKAKQSQGKQKQQNVNLNPKVDQIPIKLHSPLNCSKYTVKDNCQSSENEKHLKKLFQNGEKNYVQSQTIHYFSKSRTRKHKNKSIFVKEIVYKADDSLRKKICDRSILSLSSSKPFESPKNITAKSYVIYRTSSNGVTPKLIFSQNGKNRQEMASLTKIMTAILVIQICRRYSIDKYAQEVTVTSFQSRIGGTTASIKKGQVYTIEQLLFGLMLPSGNDASVALATWAGSKLLEETSEAVSKAEFDKQKAQGSEQKGDSFLENKQKYFKRFIEQMNIKAKSLKMKKTTYANSHGLSNPENKSCAYDLAILCQYCMQNDFFRTLVKTEKYSGYIKTAKNPNNFQQNSLSSKKSLIQQLFNRKASKTEQHLAPLKKLQIGKGIKVQWQNTHELLKKYPEEYIGIKTGITYTAGPCLSSCISHRGREYVIIVLCCESSSMRFRDTEALKKWCLEVEFPKGNNFAVGRDKKLVSLTQKVNLTKLNRKS